MRYPTVNNNVDAYFADWKVVKEPRNLRASYGHDVECVWLVMDAARTLSLSPALYRTWAEALCRTCLDLGYDREHGGFYSSGPLGQPADDTQKIWWVQSEALAGMLEMFRLTGNVEYYSAFSRTLDFAQSIRWPKKAVGGPAATPMAHPPTTCNAAARGRELITAAAP